MKFFAAISILMMLPLSAAAQSRAVVAFWNVENLHDTIPSRFYDDSDYTPAGRL